MRERPREADELPGGGAGTGGDRVPDREEAAVPGDAAGGVLVALASLQFGAVVILGKIVTGAGLPVPSFLAIRFALSAALLAAALVALRQPLRAARGEGWRLVVLGMAGYAVEATLFFAAVQRGTAAAVTLLFFTYPVLVALIAAAGGRGLPGLVVGGALAAAIAGSALVIGSSGGLDVSTAGIVLALGAALTFSIYLTGVDAVLSETKPLTASMWVSASASAALAVLAVGGGGAAWPGTWGHWLAVLGTGAFTAGAFVCLLAGLRRLGAVRTSIVAATEPLSTTVLALVFLDESLRPGTVAGGLLILGAAVAASLARRDAVLAEGPPP